MKPQVISLGHDALTEFRENMDAALQSVSKLMMSKGLKTGTVSAKIDIEIFETETIDGEVLRMMGLEPDVQMKIGSKDKYKCRRIGGLYTQIDDDGYVIAGDRQISMDELTEQEGE